MNPPASIAGGQHVHKQQKFGRRRAPSASQTLKAYVRDETGRWTLLGSPGGATNLRWRHSSRGILRHGTSFAKFNPFLPLLPSSRSFRFFVPARLTIRVCYPFGRLSQSKFGDCSEQPETVFLVLVSYVEPPLPVKFSPPPPLRHPPCHR
jgi:hypothetical protein